MVKWFNNLKLQPRLMLIFALMSVLGTLSTGFFIGRVNVLTSHLERSRQISRVAATLDRVENGLIEQRAALAQYAASGQDEALARLYAITTEGAFLLPSLDTGAYLDESEGRTAALDDLNAAYNALAEGVGAVAEAHASGDSTGATGLAVDLLAAGGPLAGSESAVRGLAVQFELDQLDIDRSAVAVRQTAVTGGALVVLLFFLLALLAALVTNGVAQPVLYLTNAIVSYECGAYQGDLLGGYDERSEEIGQLVLCFKRMVSTLDEASLQRERFLNAAQRFIPQPYLQILQKPAITDINLGDHIAARMAVLFSDIRGFTTMSEHMTASENFDFINDYIQQISPAIEDHNGFIVKFLGDGMMALFPYGIDDAMAAGLEKERINHEINRGLAERGLKGELNLGIGIHVGDMMVGMVGEEDRLQGDAFSDNVNLTSRIEGLNKTFGTRMIISEEARGRLSDPDTYRVRPLGKVQVKGRENPLALYEVIDAETEEQQQVKLGALNEYGEGLRLFEQGRFGDARSAFERLLKQNPKDGPAAFYIEQSAAMMGQATPDNWDGVIVMTSK